MAASYDNLPKEELRESLAREQGYLCCYCLTQIDPRPNPSGRVMMKIEPWAPQHQHPALQLDYQNMLGACSGNQGSPPSQQHCDTRKGEHPILIDPRAPSPHPGQLRYLGDGTILVDDPALQADIDERLNLNWSQLRSNRSEALEQFMVSLNRRLGAGKEWPRERLLREIELLEKPGKDGRLMPHVAVMAHWLRRRAGQKP